MTPIRIPSRDRNPFMRDEVRRWGRSTFLHVAAALYIALTCSGTVAAQTASRTDSMNEATGSPAQISDGLPFHREHFSYAAQDRRDPFSPPSAPGTVNPMIGGVRLVGIIHHPDARLSVVLLQVGLKSEAEGGGGLVQEPLSTGVRLRVGGSVGGTSVAEIHPGHVVVEIASPNGADRRVLDMSIGEGGRS